jgi:RING-box protein 1
MTSQLIKIKHINIISSWTYVMDKNTECTICRQSLNSDSIYAIENNTTSTLITGTCGHMFHHECINPWLRNNKKCPICSNQFL